VMTKAIFDSDLKTSPLCRKPLSVTSTIYVAPCQSRTKRVPGDRAFDLRGTAVDALGFSFDLTYALSFRLRAGFNPPNGAVR